MRTRMSASFIGEPAAEDRLRVLADRAAEAALRELPEALVIAFDRDLRFVRSSGQALERFGDPESWRPGRPLAGALPSELWRTLEPVLRSALEGEMRSRELWVGDREHCLTVDSGPLRAGGASAAVEGGVAVVLDVTVRRQAELLSAPPVSAFEEVFELAPVGTGLLDGDGRWLLVNRALCDITGYTAAELLGRQLESIVHPDDAGNDADARARLLAGEIPAYRVEKRIFDASGETVSTIVSVALVRDRDGSALHFIAQLQDVSERRRLEDELRRLADHDRLTGLRDRRLFSYDLHLQLARCRRYGEVAGLMLIDLDAFAQVNDRHGEHAGDAVLKAVSRALMRRLRETDLVARLRADQFAVLLPHIDVEGLEVVAEGLATAIAACGVDVGEQVLHPRASIGFTILDCATESTESALAEADRALRSARAARGDA